MYLPKHFEETRTDVLHQMMRAHPLGTLVTLDAGGLNANHIPFEIDPGSGPFGTLRAHVARNNPVWHDISTEIESLVVFQGARTYISPSLYATKEEGGKVVPTYNFMVAHAYGKINVIDDPVWLLAHLGRLTDSFETGRAQPWTVDDAPGDFIEKLLAAVVGIEIPINRLMGKWKISQNQPRENRVSVEQGLRAAGDPDSIAIADAIGRASQ